MIVTTQMLSGALVGEVAAVDVGSDENAQHGFYSLTFDGLGAGQVTVAVSQDGGANYLDYGSYTGIQLVNIYGAWSDIQVRVDSAPTPITVVLSYGVSSYAAALKAMEALAEAQSINAKLDQRLSATRAEKIDELDRIDGIESRLEGIDLEDAVIKLRRLLLETRVVR